MKKQKNMNTRCLLVDDEPLALKILESYISSIPHLEMVAKCRNAFEALSILNEKKIDLMFLDINMPALSGTEFLRAMKNPPKVIFTTAHENYALQGFELDAVDFLLKPISLERFMKCIAKVFSIQGNSAAKESTELHSLRSDFLYFRVDRKMVKVVLNEILFIESLKDYVKIVRENQKPLIVKQSISSLEIMLPQHLFSRIHRSYIVSLNKLTAYTNHDVEINENMIPIGKQYANAIDKFSKIV